MKSPVPVLAILAASALCGCRSTWHDARFVPAPLEVELTAEGEPGAQARALLTVVGIRRATGDQPAEVVVRLRIDNMGESPLALVPEGFDCVTGDLVSLAPPRIEPAIGAPLEQGASETWVASFAVPAGRTAGDLDWRGLNVQWTVAFVEKRVTTGVTFDRAPYYAYPYGYGYYHDPFWGYPYGHPYPYRSHVQVGVGVGATVGG